MSNQDQTTPPSEQPGKQAQGTEHKPEIQPVPPQHDKKPETAHDEPPAPKTAEPS